MPHSATLRGTLVLVVGPSGAGKDTILAEAAERLRGDRRIVFAHRLITRPADASGENHVALSPTEFARLRQQRGLMLHWRAHGFDYGLHSSLNDVLSEGRIVVANVSRTVVDEARRRLAPVAVVSISAAPETLAARLAQRGRENAGEIRERLQRAATVAVPGTDYRIENNGALERAVSTFVALLDRLVAGAGAGALPASS